MRVLMVASEIYPLAKTGGLADVCSALPKALTSGASGVDLRLLMPAYPEALDRACALQLEADLGAVCGAPARLWRAATPDSGLPLWLLDCPALYARRGGPYQDEDQRDWPDNFRRFAALSQVAARLALGRIGDWRADLVHGHDWHAGLLPLLLQLAGETRPRSVFTVHNAAFQGNFPLAEAAALGLPASCLTPDGAEFYGQFSCLKAGIRYADAVTTVSPGYARELQTAEFGCGLQDLFRARGDSFRGIRNGIDAELWNPAGDPHLSQPYSRPDCGGKAACKLDLQRRLQLREDAEAPLAISASRITSQKMADVLLAGLPQMLARHPQLQFALIGRGERTLEEGFSALAQQYPGRVAIRIGYDEALAHRLHAGADLLLHGSRFEPCGLVHLYAMRYGTLPIVRRVGGLADSVIDAEDAATGFIFDEVSGEALQQALERGLDLYQRQRSAWQYRQHNAMAADFGWRRSAAEYWRLYRALTGVASDDAREGPAAPWSAAA